MAFFFTTFAFINLKLVVGVLDDLLAAETVINFHSICSSQQHSVCIKMLLHSYLRMRGRKPATYCNDWVMSPSYEQVVGII